MERGLPQVMKVQMFVRQNRVAAWRTPARAANSALILVLIGTVPLSLAWHTQGSWTGFFVAVAPTFLVLSLVWTALARYWHRDDQRGKSGDDGPSSLE